MWNAQAALTECLHYGSKVTKEIFIEVSFDGGEELHEAHFASTDADTLLLRSEAHENTLGNQDS